MSKDQTITATEASRAFSDLLHRVCYGGESFVIKKGQRLMARIAPVEIPSSPEPQGDSRAIQDSHDQAPQGRLDSPGILQEQHSGNDVDNVATDEAEFYRAWMEQVKKVELNDSPIDF